MDPIFPPYSPLEPKDINQATPEKAHFKIDSGVSRKLKWDISRMSTVTESHLPLQITIRVSQCLHAERFRCLAPLRTALSFFCGWHRPLPVRAAVVVGVDGSAVASLTSLIFQQIGDNTAFMIHGGRFFSNESRLPTLHRKN
ncbi:hypothetical protein CEXT_231051 [Caerostris extrusa]|uniref:Uncharacterized protein n=1 Tax=Caerostris extrusa TaxID=172846 RepID=A0AAV4RVP4_CAEEX|nr:hypothetical protein CEXT_231051 [Caerostris extrusa]